MTHFSPTDEQMTALKMAMTGDSFKIVAYAGAGKTSTLKLISEQKKGRGLYLAFNKAIANDAQSKFPPNVRCQTFHSLAFRHVHRAITAKISLPKLTPAKLADALKLTPITVNRVQQKPSLLTPFLLGGIVSESLKHFCKTNSEYPAPRHIILPDWIDPNDLSALQKQLYPALETHWLQSIDPRHSGGIEHDVYLKLWTLSNPIIPADFILFDEAQDADPLMMGALMKQPCQTIYVGDAHQQIYEWRGAVNAMKRLPLPQSRLTQSFRFGEKIADIANQFLSALQESIPLKGNPDITSIVQLSAKFSQKDAILCRTNATAISELLKGLKLGHKVALQADSQRILRFCQGADNLKLGKRSVGIAELAPFGHWREVQEFSETPSGLEIKTWVRLIEEYGTQTISQAMNKLTPPQNADYIVSTAHKAKGLEWGRVIISDDFLYERTPLSVKISPEELRLLYVACTRAKTCLNIHSIADLLGDLPHKKLIYV